MTAPLLDVEGLVVRHGATVALRGVDLAAAGGSATALLGANGAGKSSLLRALMGLIPAAGGRVRLDGEDITDLPPEQRARRGIGYCPEGRRVFPGLSVRENLAVGCWADRRERERRIEAALAADPILAEHQARPAWQLSGGQQQVLALARALMNAPRLLLLDEPSLGLAPLLVAASLGRIPAIAASGTSVLLAEQNALRALAVCDAAIVLDRGRVAAAGTTAELRAGDALRTAFLGA